MAATRSSRDCDEIVPELRIHSTACNRGRAELVGAKAPPTRAERTPSSIARSDRKRSALDATPSRTGCAPQVHATRHSCPSANKPCNGIAATSPYGPANVSTDDTTYNTDCGDTVSGPAV